MPLDESVVEDWGRALNADGEAPPGALAALCLPGEPVTTETAWAGFHRRFSETPGIITASSGKVIIEGGTTEVQLILRERVPEKLPPKIEEALAKVRAFWRPDTLVGSEYDEPLLTALEQAKCAQEVVTGVLYRWRFDPINGVPQKRELIGEWYKARKDFFCELRSKLLPREQWLDSPNLCERAAMRAWGDLPEDPTRPSWRSEYWPRWRDIKDRVQYQTEAKRLDDYLVRDAAAWAREHTGIVWYKLVEFGKWVAEVSGLPLHGGGPKAPGLLKREDGRRSIVASIQSHGRGRDGLQRIFSEQLIANNPSSATMWEQCLDSQTEVLTEDGWLGKDADWRGVKAAGYSVTDGSIRWESADKMERALGHEQMYGISNPHLDIRVTAGHRMICERQRRKGAGGVDGSHYTEREIVHAVDMPVHSRIPLAGQQGGCGVPLTDHELTFLGLFMTDGNLSPGNNAISLFQSERYPEVIALIERTIAGCGFKAGHSVNRKPSNFGKRSPLHRWAISKGAPIGTQKHLRGWGALEPYVGKALPPALDDMTTAQLRVLLLAMWAGDGSKTPGTYAYDVYEPGTLNIATKRRVVADRVQSLCVRRGMRCNVSHANGMFMVRVSLDVSTWTVSRVSGDERPVWGVLPSDSAERVWCVTVRSGAIVTRRNGKVAVVGNCLGRMHRQGQDHAVVNTWFYRHTAETAKCVDQALRRANYVNGVLKANQKITMGWKPGEE